MGMTKNEVRAALRKKTEAGLLPPQTCPNCKTDLSDPDVPEKFSAYRAMFGLAREVELDPEYAAWTCPACLHVWGKHRRKIQPTAP